MMDLEQNLDAYRVLADILRRLRGAVRDALEARHGGDWHRLPELADVVDRLIERKEREKAIDWYSTEYQALMDFATFQDLLEIFENLPGLIPQIKILVPSRHLMHARMLELETLREKIAMAREITEGEISFLTTFHQRFRKAMNEIEQSGPLPPVRDEAPAEEKKAAPDPEPEARTEEKATQDADHGTAPVEVNPPRAAAERRVPAGAAVAGAAVAVEEASKEAAPGIHSAIEERDTKAILQHLYREVTAIADGLFSSENTPTPVCWRSVRSSEWYEANFSPLGLQPLSDFYAIVDEAMERRESGADATEIQEFLKQHNFAKVLLSLRDMFQKNRL